MYGHEKSVKNLYVNRMIIKARGRKGYEGKTRRIFTLFFPDNLFNENKIKRHVNLLIKKMLCS